MGTRTELGQQEAMRGGSFMVREVMHRCKWPTSKGIRGFGSFVFG